MKEIKLSLGSGNVNLGKDWIHIDATKHPHVEYTHITNLSQFEDNSVDLIYASHVLEYFDRREALIVLTEWYRVLKKGGVIRLAVPDFEALTKLYLGIKIVRINNKNPIMINSPRKKEIRDIIGPLFGRMESNGEIIYHKTTYDFETLAQLLYQIGFKRITKYDCESVKPYNKIDDQSHAYIPHRDKKGTLISLNVEATK